jgi:hypothetical protein
MQWLAAAALLALLAQPAGAVLPDAARFGVVVESGDLRTVRTWLDEGLDPEFVADRVGTGLMIAAWEGNIPMMELFVSRGADVNRANRVGEQALMHAAWKGQIEAVRWLLERGARINQTGQGWSALHYAAFAGHDGVVRLLLERGADINARAPNGASPLMMAAREGREGIARLLIERGADTAIRSDWGDDAVALAMRYDHLRIAFMVATPARFAEAAKRPPAARGEPSRSVPMPEKVEALLREMRFLETMGHLTPEMKAGYLGGIEALRREAEAPPAAAEAAPPKALEITAKRGAPGEEKAELLYEDSAAAPLPPPPAPKAPPPATVKAKPSAPAGSQHEPPAKGKKRAAPKK